MLASSAAAIQTRLGSRLAVSSFPDFCRASTSFQTLAASPFWTLWTRNTVVCAEQDRKGRGQGRKGQWRVNDPHL